MAARFYDEVEFETIALEVARDAVVYSFIAQKSLTYLDLSACEYTLDVKSIFTEEQCRKLVEPRRQILYTLNLDLPKDLESSLRAVKPHSDDQEQSQTFHLGVVFVCECVYTRDLGRCIIKLIMSAENRIEKLRRCLHVIKLLKLNDCRSTAMLLFDHLILAMYPFCPDSNLVIEFAITLGFCSWIFHTESHVLVSYVLYHALRIGYNIWQMHEWRLDPINGCILYRKPGNIRILLEYGIIIRFEPCFYLEVLGNLLEPRRMRRLRRKKIPHRRLFLIVQLFCYFLLNNRSWEGLLFIWRSIPDPCLTKSEISLLFESVISLRELHNMIELYKFYIVEETDEIDEAVPRSLQHLCRVTVRSVLIRNYQLPFGISRLGMPRIIRNYLDLKC